MRRASDPDAQGRARPLRRAQVCSTRPQLVSGHWDSKLFIDGIVWVKQSQTTHLGMIDPQIMGEMARYPLVNIQKTMEHHRF